MAFKDIFASTGWRRRGIAALCGVCATATLPPIYLLPLIIPAFSGLFLLVRSAPKSRQAFWDGWWWGLGHFTTGLYWICVSLYVEPDKFAWLTPFALFGLPSVLGIYTGLAASLSHLAFRKIQKPEWQVLFFTALWVIVEHLRSHLFTGFPWNLTGYVWTISDITLQLASLFGVYGLSWMAVLVGTMPALFLLDPKAALRPNLIAATLLIIMIGFGAWRLEEHPTQYSNVKIRVVQGNIPQTMKFDPKAAVEGLRKYARLTRLPGIESVKLVLWPETAVPFYIVPDSELTHDLGTLLPENTLLITGGLRGDPATMQAWNSVFAINHGGAIAAIYDKHHLVPFGEYIPLRSILPKWLESVANGMGDFSRGPGPRTLSVSSYPAFSPLVCYEAVFPDQATDGTSNAEWLANVTNDAWFGVSSGPFQHLEMARVRAVEQGLPLIRAANTGISAAFDAYGRELEHLPLEKEGSFDLYLPLKDARDTLYAKYHGNDWILLLIGGSALFITKKRRNIS